MKFQTFESYHGRDPLKQMRQLKGLDVLSDEQCIQLHKEVSAKAWSKMAASPEAGYAATKWLLERARQMAEATS